MFLGVLRWKGLGFSAHVLHLKRKKGAHRVVQNGTVILQSGLIRVRTRHKQNRASGLRVLQGPIIPHEQEASNPEVRRFPQAQEARNVANPKILDQKSIALPQTNMDLKKGNFQKPILASMLVAGQVDLANKARTFQTFLRLTVR